MKKNSIEFKKPTDLIIYLNDTYTKLHKAYEELFWISYMCDHSIDNEKDQALNERDFFRTNKELLNKVTTFLVIAKGEEKERLLYWKKFFESFQTPDKALELKVKINTLESKIQQTRSSRPQYYIDPKTNKKVEKNINTIKNLMVTHEEVAVRKACFDALQKLSEPLIEDFLELIKLRNEYAKALGYEDFYAYKVFIEEGMTKKELFSIFYPLYDKTKYAFTHIRNLEKTRKGIREPWNFSFIMTGSFIKEEEPYFPFQFGLEWWGRTFQNLGIDFKGGSLVLDLVEREGKYNNGFCHWPELVHYKKGKRVPGKAQFTCNFNQGIPGQSLSAMSTLFHEGGHAAHFLNVMTKDVCLNNEYAPMSTAWAETQSMFLDTVFSSIEWKMRYVKDINGNPYPFELFERKVKALEPLRPRHMMGIMSVMYFEKELYEAKKLDKEKLYNIAKKTYTTFTDFKTTSLTLLEIPHIYAWESSCSYHGYALAELALSQWREYFYKKYGYIVDNKMVGKEMEAVWKLGASRTFPEFVKIATGKKLSANAYIKNITKTNEKIIAQAKEKIKKLSSIKSIKKPIVLNAYIEMVHGKKIISTNKKSFEDVAEKYAKFLLLNKKD